MHVKFGMKTDHKHAHLFCGNTVYKPTIKNMMIVWNFEVICEN